MQADPTTRAKLFENGEAYVREYHSTRGTFLSHQKYYNNQLADLKTAAQTEETQEKCAEIEARLKALTTTWKEEEEQIREKYDRIMKQLELGHFLSEVCGSYTSCDQKYDRHL